MKNIYIRPVFVLAACAAVFFTNCNNPIMEKWWAEPDAAPQIINNIIPGDGGNVKTITVKFETSGGFPKPADRQVPVGRKIEPPEPMLYEKDVNDEPDKGFKGWYWDKECTILWGFNIPLAEGNNETRDILTLYADWADPEKAEVTFTVNFVNNGGSTTPADQKIASGAMAIEVSAGTKDRAGFAGWHTDEACTIPWNFENPVTENLTLYAKWAALDCTVVFNANGGSPAPANQGLASGSKAVAPPAMTREAATFDGWYTDPAFSGEPWDFGEPVTAATMVLYAKWITNHCVVQFNANGGSPAPASQSLTYGAKVTAPPAITQNGKIFIGWYTDDNTFMYAWDFDQRTVNGSIILYAKWVLPSYTVTFDVSGEDVTPDLDPALRKQTVITGSKVIKLPPLSKPDMGFGGWYTAENPDTAWDIDSAVKSDLNLYAKWDVNRFTVSFDITDGNPATKPPDQIIASNARVVEPPPPTKDNFGFGGWYRDNAYNTPWNFSTDTVTTGMTLHAKWDTNKYTVTFEPNGGIGKPAGADQTVAYGGKVTVPSWSMTKTGKSFSGWYADPALTYEWNFDQNTVLADITLYAKWETAVYTVIFDTTTPFNNASEVPSQLVVYGSKVNIPANPTRSADDAGKDGYVFKGWYTSSDPTNKDLYDFDTSVIEETPKTLYARWVMHNPLMAWIPGGTFTMGGLGGTGATTRPAHKVSVSGFYMFAAEITQGAFHSVHWWKRNGDLKNYVFENSTPDKGVWAFNPSAAKGYYRPVESITWYDAVYFCNLVTEYENAMSRKGIDPFELPYIITNIKHGDGATGTGVSGVDTRYEIGELADYSTNKSITGAMVTLNPKLDPNSGIYAPQDVGYRLPTEAEWEYAARGGNGSPGDYLWAGSNTANDVAWYGGGSGNTTQTQVWGQKAPNSFGIYDMSGNVCEWLWDWYDKDYYRTSLPGTAIDPVGPDSSPTGERTRRGGSIRHTADNCRTQVRDFDTPNNTNWNIGFRLARTGEE